VTEAAVASLPGGVHRITLPLPWALDHVHCYAIEDTDGWTIVDAGLGTESTTRRWAGALEALGSPRVHRIVITHYHPDHVGASLALAELTGADEVVQGRDDAAITRRAWGSDVDMGALEEYLRLHGMPPGEATRSTDEEERIPVTFAQPTLLVDEGDEIEIAGERFSVLVLPGHADGHIALLGERTGRLLSGDVLLREITPNVGRWEDTLPDPLGRYLETLSRIEDLRPVLVYPGHRQVIDDPAGRAAEIRVHHAERLDQHVEALRDGAQTAYEVGVRLWGGELGLHERRFALAESLAHLERLELEGRAEQVEPGRWRTAL
jgi:glyoxylase-like metal-dependent hydrolase (beta-lactamase superfamily II)